MLDGDEPFLLEFAQHHLFSGEEIVLILVLKILQEKPLFGPKTKKERFQSELFHIMCISFGVACIDPYLCPFEQGWFLPYPHSQ